MDTSTSGGDKLPLFNRFANTLSLADDDTGGDADRLWGFYHDLMPSILGWIKNFIFPDIGKEILKQPGERLSQDKLNEIESKALAELKKRTDNAFLIYGHTHRPKVDNQNRCANTGSWVDDPNLPSVQKNTYLQISDTSVTLKEW